MNRSRVPGMALEATRAAYGLSLLRRHGTMDRLLGARLVLQGGGTAVAGGEPAVHGCGGAVDVLHALSMVGLAAVSRSRRREALHAALSATGLAAAEGLLCAVPGLTRSRS